MSSERRDAEGAGCGRELPARETGGFALVTVLFVLMLMSAIGAASLTTTSDQRDAGRAVRESAKAFYAAEAGMNAVTAGWASAKYDTSLTVPGDSLIVGPVTIENGCSYRALIRRVDGGSGPLLFSVTSAGRSSGPAGAQRSLRTILTLESSSEPSGLVFDAPIEISGNPTLTGECAGVWANGNIKVGGDLTVDGGVTSSGTVSGGDKIKDSDGNPVTPVTGADPIDVPVMTASDYCDQADYILRNGWAVPTASPQDSVKNGYGWTWNSGDNVYELKGSSVVPGTFCVKGSAKLADDFGLPYAPTPISILADGYVEVSGNPYMTADHPDGVLIIAGGDLKLNGNAAFGQDNFEGIVYGGAQCEVSGEARLTGSLLCQNGSDPAGVKSLVSENKINGNMHLKTNCSSSSGAASQLVSGRGWLQLVY